MIEARLSSLNGPTENPGFYSIIPAYCLGQDLSSKT